MALGLSRREALSAVLLAAAVSMAVLYDGGFAARPRVLFAVLALAALVAAIVADPAAAARAARRPVVLVLWGLAILAAVSASWTVGFEAASLRWAAVTGGFGAVAVAAAVNARRSGGVETIAAAICLVAFASGCIGLAAAATHSAPFADRIGGSWRPGGTLEYSSANALLQVSVLPAVLLAACRERRALAAAGIAGAVVAAMVLALADSRLELAMGAAVCAVAIAVPGASARSDRRTVGALVALLVVSGLAAHLVAGRYTAVGADGGGAGRVLLLAAIAAAASGLWMAGRRLSPRARWRATAAALACAVAALLIAVAAGAGLGAQRDDSGYGIEAQGGVLHNRSSLWHAAVETFADHPWRGSGANSFLVASAPHQEFGPVRFAHSIPLELLAELGVAGGVLAVMLYLSSGTVLWSARRSREGWLFGPAVAAFLIAGLLDWPWHLAGSGAVWALALGAILLATNDYPRNDR